MPLPYQVHSETSRAAALAYEQQSWTSRQRVFEAIRNFRGLTDEEVCTLLAMNPSTERPRRVELERAGLIRDSGQQRATRSGMQAVVWIEIEGRQYHDHLFRQQRPPTPDLTGDEKAVAEIRERIPERNRSPELCALLERLDYEIHSAQEPQPWAQDDDLFSG